jgi:diacylglycerol O-acyltransferase
MALSIAPFPNPGILTRLAISGNCYLAAKTLCAADKAAYADNTYQPRLNQGMQRLKGSDAVFLYRETPTSLMHTLKGLILSRKDREVDFQTIYQDVRKRVNANPLTRQRILGVPFGIHHPVRVEDPDFDLKAHLFRAAIPAPGTMRELDQMVAQIGSTQLDRSRPLWELWVLEGLEDDRIAIVHKIHHCMADGKAYLGLLTNSWDITAETEPSPPPLPTSRRLLWDALTDHLKHDIWNLWPLLKSFTGNLLELRRQSLASKEPRINPLTADFPRLRFNYALGVKRSFATQQLAMSELKALKDALGVTLNDVVLSVVAGALRDYLIYHKELPDAPLAVSVPVGADEPGVMRSSGNNVTNLTTMIHLEIEDPIERLFAIKKHTEQGKADLEIFGKHQWSDLMQYVPPNLFTWSRRRNFRTKPANRPDYRPTSNLVISNVPGPREPLENELGRMESLYSVGVLGEGLGLGVTVWSYLDQMNFGVLACDKAMPDPWRLAQNLPLALEKLQFAVSAATEYQYRQPPSPADSSVPGEQQSPSAGGR